MIFPKSQSQAIPLIKSYLLDCFSITSSQKQNGIFLSPDVKELLETSQMSHFPPFSNVFSCRNLIVNIEYFILW